MHFKAQGILDMASTMAMVEPMANKGCISLHNNSNFQAIFYLVIVWIILCGIVVFIKVLDFSIIFQILLESLNLDVSTSRYDWNIMYCANRKWLLLCNYFDFHAKFDLVNIIIHKKDFLSFMKVVIFLMTLKSLHLDVPKPIYDPNNETSLDRATC